MDDSKNKVEKNADKLEKIREMRERLAKNYGTSNYYFYLKSNILSKGAGGR